MSSQASSQRPSYFDCYFSGFRNRFGTKILQIFDPPEPSKTSIFIEKVIIFEVFEVSRSNACFVAYWQPLGLNFGAFPTLLGKPWGHFSGPKATTPKFPSPFWKLSASKCALNHPKLPKRYPLTPQKCQKGPPGPPQGRRGP